MPTQLTCTCGQLLRVPDEIAAKKIACPRCQAVILLADKRPARPDLAPAGYSKVQEAPLLDMSLDTPELIDDAMEPELLDETPELLPVAPATAAAGAAESARPAKKKKRQARERRKSLEKVSLGLAFHVVAPFVFLPSMWTGWIALALLMMSNEPDLSDAAVPFTFLAVTSAIFMILTALVDIPTAVFCLRVQDGAARGLLIASLACRGLAIALSVLVFFLESLRATMLLLAFAPTIASWVLWMCFLSRVGAYLDRPEFTGEALRTLLSGVKTLVATVAILFMVAGMFMLIVYIKIVFARYALFSVSVSVFFAMVRIFLAVGQIDSVVMFLLAPTGIPFIFGRHLPLVGSLRTVIERRT